MHGSEPIHSSERKAMKALPSQNIVKICILTVSVGKLADDEIIQSGAQSRVIRVLRESFQSPFPLYESVTKFWVVALGNGFPKSPPGWSEVLQHNAWGRGG